MRPQLADVVRVGQDAHVEHVVGVQRNAMLERERLEHQRQAARAGLHQLAHPGTQLGGPQQAGVDDGGDLAQLGKDFALELDRVEQRAVVVLRTAGLVRQRMGAARLGEAPHQRVAARVEEHGANRHAFAAQLLHQRQQVRQGSGAARVDGDRDAALRALLFQPQEFAQQLGWQVVDTEEPGVFERVQRHRFSGAGDARHQHHFSR